MLRTGLEHLIEKLAEATVAARPRANLQLARTPAASPPPRATPAAPLAGGEKTWLPPDLAYNMATGRINRPSPVVSGSLPRATAPAAAGPPKVIADSLTAGTPSLQQSQQGWRSMDQNLGAQAAQSTRARPAAQAAPGPSLGAQAAQAARGGPQRPAAPRGGGGGWGKYLLPAGALAAGGLALSQMGGNREDDRYKNLVYAPTGGGAYG